MYGNCTTMTGKLAAVTQLPGNTLELIFAATRPLVHVQGRVEIRLPVLASMTPAKQAENRATLDALTGPKGFAVGDVIQVQGMTLYDPITKTSAVVANAGAGGFTRIKAAVPAETAPVPAAATTAPQGAQPVAAVATTTQTPKQIAVTQGAIVAPAGMTREQTQAWAASLSDEDVPF